INSAFLLRAVTGSQSSRENYIRIVRIDYDSADTSRLFQTHMRPGLPGIRRFVDSVSDGYIAANKAFARAGPNYVRIRCSYSKRPDRHRGLVIEDRPPVDAAVIGLPNAAGRSSDVVDIFVARSADHCADSISLRSDESQSELAQAPLINLLSERRQHITNN